MATLQIARPIATGQSFGGRIAKFMHNSAEKFERWMQIRATKRALSALSDRELEDIGFTRGDVDHMGS